MTKYEVTVMRRIDDIVNCTALLLASQLGVGVQAVSMCVKCESWPNNKLRRDHACENNPPGPSICSRQTSARCMIATDYAADGGFHI